MQSVMAWENRDYYREGRSPFRVGGAGGGRMFGLSVGPTVGSVVFWLLILNIAVFFLDGILTRILGPVIVPIAGATAGISMSPIESAGYFSFDRGILGLQIWRLLTFQFLHLNLWHLLGNMLGLFFFGAMVEGYFGSRRFLAFYLLSGLMGAVTYVGLWAMGLFIGASWTPLIGASAGVFAVLAAAAVLAPNTQVLLFFIVPVPLKLLVWGLLFIAAFTVIAQGADPGSNAGGQAAHLGGALLGYLLVRNPDWLAWAERITPDPTSVTRSLRQRHQQRQRQRDVDEQAQVDRILEKVKNQGLHSLTRREKKTLNRATQRQRRAG